MGPCSSDGLVWVRAAQMFPLPVHGLKCSSSRAGFWEAGITCALGMGHTAGPGDSFSPVSESVSWEGMDNADCY